MKTKLYEIQLFESTLKMYILKFEKCNLLNQNIIVQYFVIILGSMTVLEHCHYFEIKEIKFENVKCVISYLFHIL